MKNMKALFGCSKLPLICNCFLFVLTLAFVSQVSLAQSDNNKKGVEKSQTADATKDDEEEKEPKREAMTMDELLNFVEEGLLSEAADHQAREARFRTQRNQQQTLLAEAEAERLIEEERSERLEAKFEKNQDIIAIKREQLQASLGSLIELFGHMTIAANDLRSTLQSSVVSAQYKGRIEFLDELLEKISESDRLPSVEEVERLWFEMQREMVESGRIVRFETEVTKPNGTKDVREVVRVGSFNVIDKKGRYLDWSADQEKLTELARQPADTYTDWARSLSRADADEEDLLPFAVDPTGPTGGSFLSSLIDAPTLYERWQQGGIIGFIISIVGLFALWLAITRMLVLRKVGAATDAQLDTQTVSMDNPLGRILAIYESNKKLDVESLEIKISEAILHERPQLEQGQAWLKIIAAIAPLMGLLGTVTGMILTFQGIVIFGAGDPKAMAGGISQALVTTVLGLIVAIPTVLLHTMVSGRSAKILHILEEKSLALIAVRSESK